MSVPVIKVRRTSSCVTERKQSRMIGMIQTFIKDLIESYIQTTLDLLKVETAIAYLNIIKGTRRFFIIFALLLSCAVIFACGFLIIPIALLLFMRWEPQTKVIVGIIIGAAYIFAPIIVGSTLLSQKRWMRMSRAKGLLHTLKK